MTSNTRPSPSTIKYSVWQSPERSWDELKAGAQWADARGFYSWWFADHFTHNTGDDTIVDGPVHECWSILSAIAAVTDRIRVGSLVSPTTVRHPAVLANTAATIDHISHGRLTLGLGAGWQINEHRAYGFDLLQARDRVDRFEEAITIISSLLTQRRTDVAGRHFTFLNAPCEPLPLQQPLPLMVGTGGPRMTAITVRHAHEWNTWGSPDEAARRIAVLDAACERVGRDPRTIHRSVQALFMRASDPATAERIRSVAPADRSVIGSTDEFRAAIERYAELGFDEVIVPDFTLGDSPEARRESYEWFADEVLEMR